MLFLELLNIQLIRCSPNTVNGFIISEDPITFILDWRKVVFACKKVLQSGCMRCVHVKRLFESFKQTSGNTCAWKY